MRYQLLLIFLLLLSSNLSAQFTLKGTVTNSQNEPLAFVNILINGDPYQGISTDIDGKFLIKNETEIETLHLSYIGYESKIYTIKNADYQSVMKIYLAEASIDLVEAVVIAGENPAHRIIKKTVTNRKINNPEKWDSYQCRTYNKMQVDFQPDEEGFEKKLAAGEKQGRFGARQDTVTKAYMAVADQRHLSVMETVTEKSFLAPDNHQEKVIKNRVSGFKKPNFVALAKDAQPFTFYETQLDVLGTTYLNPISVGSTKQYFFDLRDTLYQGRDTVFIIAYKPRKGKTFSGLKGVLYINTNQYAIQNVIAEPSDQIKTNIKIEQKYVQVAEGKWFPEQLNLEWVMPKYPMPHMGLKIVGKSYISDVHLQVDLDKKDFTADKYIFAEDVYSLEDTVWQAQREEDLTAKESDTYAWWDSVADKTNFEQKIKLAESLVSKQYEWGKVNIDVNRLYDFNDFEGNRLDFGLHTNDDFSKRFRFGGYVAYGFQDKQWKYGSDASVLLHKRSQLRWTLGYQKDTEVPGTPQYPKRRDDRTLFQSYYDFNMDNVEDIFSTIQFTILKNADFILKFSHNIWQPNYEYDFVLDDVSHDKPFRFTEISAGFRWAYGEEYVPFMGARIANPTRFPVVQFAYTQGLDILDGNYIYNKKILAVAHNFILRKLGTTRYRVEAGWVNGLVPYGKLFTSSGAGGGFELFDFDNYFQTMTPYEFLSDKYVHLFLKHNFGILSRKFEWSRPELSIAQNVGFGDYKQTALHQNIDYQTMEQGYLESGIIIDNLLRINYVNIGYLGLGWATYYRYGAYQLDNPKDNFAYRLTVDITF